MCVGGLQCSQAHRGTDRVQTCGANTEKSPTCLETRKENEKSLVKVVFSAVHNIYNVDPHTCITSAKHMTHSTFVRHTLLACRSCKGISRVPPSVRVVCSHTSTKELHEYYAHAHLRILYIYVQVYVCTCTYSRVQSKRQQPHTQ